jgi:undecaprenyl-diphosphatase
MRTPAVLELHLAHLQSSFCILHSAVMDSAIVTWFASHRSAPLDALAVFLTFAGRAGLMFVAAAIVRGLVNRKLAMAAWQTVLAVAVASLLADGILKPVAHRPRPFDESATLQVVGDRPTSGSFPSGHAATCVAAAFLLASTWPRARAGIWAAAALVALSRVYLGVHYPTDVLAGALVGWFAGWFARGRTAWRWRADAAARGTPA